jgi:dUTP pyrophosphatase
MFTEDRQKQEGPGVVPNLGPAIETDVGFDLPCWMEDGKAISIPPTMFQPTMLRTGIRICTSPQIYGTIVGRSSTRLKKGLEVWMGVIDPTYTGELLVQVVNPGTNPVVVHPGQRIAQILFGWACRPVMLPTKTFTSVVRGNQGFGSTGS